MARVFLGLGSNRGDSLAIIRSAVDELSRSLGGVAVSSVYLTKPQDLEDQDDFYNLAMSGDFAGTPRELLELAHAVEARHGRDRSREVPKGPRTLDVDIELFGSLVVREDGLEVPHPRLAARRFVLEPLLEIAPEVKDPETGEPYAASLRLLGDQGIRKIGSLHGNRNDRR